MLKIILILSCAVLLSSAALPSAENDRILEQIITLENNLRKSGFDSREITSDVEKEFVLRICTEKLLGARNELDHQRFSEAVRIIDEIKSTLRRYSFFEIFPLKIIFLETEYDGRGVLRVKGQIRNEGKSVEKFSLLVRLIGSDGKLKDEMSLFPEKSDGLAPHNTSDFTAVFVYPPSPENLLTCEVLFR